MSGNKWVISLWEVQNFRGMLKPSITTTFSVAQWWFFFVIAVVIVSITIAIAMAMAIAIVSIRFVPFLAFHIYYRTYYNR